MNYAQLAFTDAVKSLQEANGSRRAYERMEKQHVTGSLQDDKKRRVPRLAHGAMQGGAAGKIPAAPLAVIGDSA